MDAIILLSDLASMAELFLFCHSGLLETWKLPLACPGKSNLTITLAYTWVCTHVHSCLHVYTWTHTCTQCKNDFLELQLSVCFWFILWCTSAPVEVLIGLEIQGLLLIYFMVLWYLGRGADGYWNSSSRAEMVSISSAVDLFCGTPVPLQRYWCILKFMEMGRDGAHT